jgi:hypothetical protein
MALSKKSLMVLATLFLVGCGAVASSSRIFTADGKRGYAVNCSGIDRNWGHCYQKAGSICEELGYEILEVTGEAGTVTDVESTSKKSTAKTTTTHNRIMVIQCKHPEVTEQNIPVTDSGNNIEKPEATITKKSANDLD